MSHFTGLTEDTSMQCRASAMIFDIDFHPTRDFIAAGLVDGTVELWTTPSNDNSSTASSSASSSNTSTSSSSSSVSTTAIVAPRKVLTMKHHTKSCRAICFDQQGAGLYTGSSDQSVAAVDAGGAVVWHVSGAHKAPINVIRPGPTGTFFSGDDDGCVKVWDMRQQESVMSLDLAKDFIADITFNDNYTRAVTASGDGTISIINLRQQKLMHTTEMFEDDQLSILLMKNGTKVVTGTQSGALNIWAWGKWDDLSDRIPGHPQSVQTMIKYDEDTMLTGSSDGIIRIVGLHPNKLLGMIGEHEEDFPIEKISLSRDRNLVGSISHDDCIKFWDVRAMTDAKGRGSAGVNFADMGNGDGNGDDDDEFFGGDDDDMDESDDDGATTAASSSSSNNNNNNNNNRVMFNKGEGSYKIKRMTIKMVVVMDFLMICNYV